MQVSLIKKQLLSVLFMKYSGGIFHSFTQSSSGYTFFNMLWLINIKKSLKKNL